MILGMVKTVMESIVRNWRTSKDMRQGQTSREELQREHRSGEAQIEAPSLLRGKKDYVRL